MKSKLWSAVPADCKWKTDKILLKGDFTKQKNNKSRVLVLYDSYVLLYKKQDGQPRKYLKLDFDSKFEILRQAVPKKDEEDDTLGPIIGLTLMREVADQMSSYAMTASVKQIKEWRDFLSPRINQWQFHHMFRVYKKIGKGNFASVYMAEKIEDGEHMAIKAFSKQAAYAEDHGKEAIVNEIQIMRKLNSPHLMKMYECYETNNSLYVALELLEGGSLYDLIKERTILTTKQIQVILVGILEGLNHMHQKEIMHRDLKLENILFKNQKKMETVVIADFGLATHVNEPVYLYCRCGTPGYVAPEVINIKDMKAKYSSVCDVYSLGLVFYLLISGKAAFPGKSYGTVVKQNREAVVDFTIKQLQGAPANALELLKLMLEKEPKKRITAAQCLQHPFLQEQAKILQELEHDDQDPIEEPDDGSDLHERMAALNDDTKKFDAFRKNVLLNSPSISPGVVATKQFKQCKNIDSSNQMQMNSPVITGKTDSVDSLQHIGAANVKQSNFQVSPVLRPSQFKQTQQQKQPENPLLKYTGGQKK